MTLPDFKKSLKEKSPPEGLARPLLALWYEAKGSWETAHTIAQEINNPLGSRIHAYLHRKEGDNSNAGYWYSRAGVKFPELSLDAEWIQLTEELVKIHE